MAAMKFWAEQFPHRKPEHYVFPSEKCSQAGTKDRFGFAGDVFFHTDPTQPIGDVKEAWEGAKKRTRRHCPLCRTGILADKLKPESGYVCSDCKFETATLPPGLVAVRFHDLRHSAVSRMIAARVPLPIIAKTAGWTAGTMAKMAARLPLRLRSAPSFSDSVEPVEIFQLVIKLIPPQLSEMFNLAVLACEQKVMRSVPA